MASFIIEKCEKIPKHKFINYFLASFYSMAVDLLKFNEPEKYGAPEDKIYTPPPLPENKEKSKYPIFEGRYIVTDPNFRKLRNHVWPKPEVEAG